LLKEFERNGIAAAVVGEVVPSSDGLKIDGALGSRDLVHPVVDPYWGLADRLSREAS